MDGRSTGNDAGSFEALSEAWRSASDARQRARRAIPLAGAVLARSGQLGAVQILEDAALELGDADADADLGLVLEAELGFLAMLDGTTAALRWRRLDPFGALKGGTAAERRVLAAVALRCQYEGLWPADFVRAVALRAFADGRLVEDGGRDALAWAAVCGALIAADALVDAQRVVDAARDHAEATGWADGLAIVGGLNCAVLRRRGLLREAETHGRELLTRLARQQQGGGGVGLSVAHSLAETLIDRGRADQAAELLREHGIDRSGVSTDVRAMRLGVTIGVLRLDRGDPAGASAAFYARRTLEAETGLTEPEIVWREAGVTAALARDDRGLAEQLAHEQMEIAARWGGVRQMAAGRAAHAQLVDGRERVGLLSDAVGLLDDGPCRLEFARALLSLGLAEEAHGMTAEARRTLARAAAAADDCGATRLHRDAEAAGGILQQG